MGSRLALRVEPGSAEPLGASWDGEGVNFALFSAHADAVEVCLFDADGRRENERIRLEENTDGIWHGRVPGLAPGALYGYRVHGPYAPEEGHRFNHHKLLVDPWARLLWGELHQSDAVCGYRVGDPQGDLSFDERDSAPYVPRCVVVGPPAPPRSRRPATAWADTVIYEGHVRGLTMRHPGVPEPVRGTLAGLATPALITHLQRLGVTALELLPVQSFVTERFLDQSGRSNYWGYNTLGFLSPHARYLAAGDPGEFTAMVDTFHDAGIEVLLDVVYNHTAEGSELGPTLSLRGIDNASYYRLDAEAPRHYDNPTGTGNALDVSRQPARRLILDSLRAWAAMGVDGFRFDLASVLGRESEGFTPEAAMLTEIGRDPALAGCKLIAEPWDVGPGGYQLGNFPAGWSEWNDRFRDGVRRFWRGDAGSLGEFAGRLAGSSDIFEASGRGPRAGINLIAAHDGFTTRDVVSYAERHNEANGEDNRDGHAANYSANHGVEGPSDDPAIEAVRARQQRNLLTSLVLAQGVPMLLAGDEIGHSQQGNNNAYCQDNEISWLDWEHADTALADFVAGLVRLRREHPALRPESFLHDPARLAWFRPTGAPMDDAGWSDPEGRALTMRLAPEGAGAPVALCMNASDREVGFVLPGDGPWACALTSAGPPSRVDAGSWTAPAHSVGVFVGGTVA